LLSLTTVAKRSPSPSFHPTQPTRPTPYLLPSVTMSRKTVSASLNYFSPPKDGSTPHSYINKPDPASGVSQYNWEFNEQEVEIEDLRGHEGTASLDTTGFHFGIHPAKHQAFTDDKDIEREYYPESIELIKSVTGASQVVLFDHSELLSPSLTFGTCL
jgi:hypothetical protein